MIRTTKQVRISVCAALVLLAAASCHEPPPDSCAGPGRQTLVFVDQSTSSEAGAATTAMFRDTLARLVETAIPCRGDAVRAFLVHGNTRGKVGRVDVVNDFGMPDTLDLPSIQKARRMSSYRGDLDSLRAEGTARLAGLMSADVPPELRRQTDLLGTLEVISDEVAKVEPGDSVRVYYLGDMHESMRPPRRDFDADRPVSRAEAEAWADADTAVLRGMQVDRGQLSRVEVRVLLGELANRPGSPEVRSYWERLFANAGINKVGYN